MPTGTPKTTQIALRLDRSLVAAMETLAKRLSRPGLILTRSDIARLALTEGVTRLVGERRRKPER